MKLTTRTFSSLIPAVLCLILLLDASFLARDAQGRAGRGESYRSRGSDSSSSGGSSRDSVDRFRSHLNPSYTGDGKSYYHYTREYVPGDYEDDFTFNSWSSVLIVNRDGSVDVTETFDVTTSREQKGIARDVTDYFNILLISELSCPQGYAGYRADQTSALQFAFGYSEKKAAGRHVFTLKYNAIGMVVPAGSGSLLQVRLDPGKNSMMKSVSILLPAGAAARNIKAAESRTWDRFLRPDKALPCAVAGNQITVPVNREFTGRLLLAADLPAGAIDEKALRKNLAVALEKSSLPSLHEYRTRLTINPDRSVEREESYLPAPDNNLDRAIIWYDDSFRSAFFPEGSTAEDPQHVDNTLYLYGFEKKACDGDDITDASVCVPLDKSGRARTDLRYSMWGNFNPEEPLMYEFNLPPAETRWTGRVHFEITFPAFVNNEQVKPALYLSRCSSSDKNLTNQMREVTFESRWEGNRLTGEYTAALIDGQLLVVRIFLPAQGFNDPNTVKKIKIQLSYYWYTSRPLFIGAIALALLLMAGIPALAVFYIKKK